MRREHFLLALSVALLSFSVLQGSCTWFEGSPDTFLPNMYSKTVVHQKQQPQQHRPTQHNTPQRTTTTTTAIKEDVKKKTTILPFEDPLFVIWVKPMNNESLEHQWIDEVVLKKVGRVIVKAYPEVCHLDLVWNGIIPKTVMYVIGASRAPGWFADCLEREKQMRESETGNGSAKRIKLGLMHLSDEYIGWGTMCAADDFIDLPQGFKRCESRLVLYYPLFDYVLRNHWHSKLRDQYGDKVVWFPLGTVHGFGSPAINSILPSNSRKFRCSFRGCKWESRKPFFTALEKLKSSGRLSCELNGSLKFKDGIDIRGNTYTISIIGFRQELLQTKFALCPTGNYNPDSFRIYESLTAGAIPIIPKHHEFEPLGDHPIPMIESWDDMADLMDRIEREGAEALQQRIYTWWHEYIDNMQDRVAAIIG